MQVIERHGGKVLSLGPEFDRMSESDLESAAAELERKARTIQEVARVLERLPNSWTDRDPGKYGIAYWFVGEDDQRVVVRELLPNGVTKFKGDSKKWYQHLSDLGYHRPLDMVPPYMPVVSLEEVARQACPECGTEQPLIESYHQIYDSPDGDEWQKQRLVLCCSKVQVISSETRSDRF